MFKKFLFLSVILFVVILVSGCGKKEIQPIEEEQTQEITEEAQSLEIEKDGEGGWEEADGEFYFLIPEMGIKFKVKEELKDQYIYYYEKHIDKDGEKWEIANFSDKKLIQAGESCKAKYGPIGAIVKNSGIPQDYPNAIPRINDFKQFDRFFIRFSAPQSVCTNDKKYLNIINQNMTNAEKENARDKTLKTVYKYAELIN